MESGTIENRSTFVTVIAWIGIVIAGFSTFMTGLQNIIINLMMDERFDEAFKTSEPETIDSMPSFAKFMFSNFELIFFLIFLLSLVALIASIGLLKRKNWARLTIIGVLGLGIAWNLGGLIFQQSFMGDMEEMQEKSFEQMEQYERKEHERQLAKAEEDPCCENTDPCCKEPLTWEERQKRIDERKAQWREMNQKSKNMMTLMTTIGILTALLFSAIEGWIIWKLTRPAIVKEFKTDTIGRNI